MIRSRARRIGKHIPGGAQPFATLPQAFVNTTWAKPAGGTTWNVNNAAELTTALAGCVGGDLIILNKANTFSGSTYTLRNLAGSAWVYIMSSDASFQVDSSTRVTTNANMPMVQSAGSPNVAFQTNPGAHHYRFVGLEITNVAAATGGLFRIGNGETTIATLPHDNIIDRCYIHGDSVLGAIRGVQMDGVSCAVINSFLFDFKDTGNDTQAIWAYNTPGPLKIENNRLEATGENILFGGADPTIPLVLISDVEIRKNYFFKQPAWVNTSFVVKNLFESKCSQRVLIEKNMFDGCWKPTFGQSGYGLNIKTANQGGGQPWAITRDLTIRLNKFQNVEGWATVSDKDPGVSLQTTRILLANNIALVTSPFNSNATPGDGRPVMLLGNLVSIRFDHNTGLILASGSFSSGEFFSYADGGVAVQMVDLEVVDNIWSAGDFGWDGPGAAEGTASLNFQCSSYTFQTNALIGTSNTYPATNIKPANVAAMLFVNYAGGNYILQAGSPGHNTAGDGTDMGAPVASVEAFAALAISGA